jgi:hypothetical protein
LTASIPPRRPSRFADHAPRASSRPGARADQSTDRLVWAQRGQRLTRPAEAAQSLSTTPGRDVGGRGSKGHQESISHHDKVGQGPTDPHRTERGERSASTAMFDITAENRRQRTGQHDDRGDTQQRRTQPCRQWVKDTEHQQDAGVDLAQPPGRARFRDTICRVDESGSRNRSLRSPAMAPGCTTEGAQSTSASTKPSRAQAISASF